MSPAGKIDKIVVPNPAAKSDLDQRAEGNQKVTVADYSNRSNELERRAVGIRLSHSAKAAKV